MHRVHYGELEQTETNREWSVKIGIEFLGGKDHGVENFEKNVGIWNFIENLAVVGVRRGQLTPTVSGTYCIQFSVHILSHLYYHYLTV